MDVRRLAADLGRRYGTSLNSLKAAVRAGQEAQSVQYSPKTLALGRLRVRRTDAAGRCQAPAMRGRTRCPLPTGMSLYCRAFRMRR